MVSYDTLLLNLNPICQWRTVSKIYTRTFVIIRHLCHRCIYLLLIIIITFITFFYDAWLLLSLKRTCFCCFSLSLGGLGHLSIRWSSYLYLKHLWGVRSVRRFSESSAAQYFYFYFLIVLEHFSVEWLAPPQKVYFVWKRFSLSLFLPEPELMSRFKESVCRDGIDKYVWSVKFTSLLNSVWWLGIYAIYSPPWQKLFRKICMN